MTRNTTKIWGEETAPGLIGRSSEDTSSWVYSSESKKRSRDQSEKKSWEVKDYRKGKEEENIGIPPTTPEWGTSRKHHPLEGH